MALQSMKIKIKSTSYNQNQLKVLSDNICDNIEEVLSRLDISEYRLMSRMLTMSCPIHGGDNESALNLYHEGDTYRGNWKCRTHQCEKVFKASVIGFIRGVLSHKKFNWVKDGDPTVSFQETIAVINDILGEKNIDQLNVDSKEIEKQKFSNTIKYLSKEHINRDIVKIDKNLVKKSLDIPSPYFLSRGFSSEILKKFDVGECLKPNKEMYLRAVVPIYDLTGKWVVACTGRSIFDKCSKCSSFHSPETTCPSKTISKWRHSSGFRSEENLYNIWNAKNHITDTKTVIIVESPGNVWRLEEAGIYNAVAVFGSSLSDKQKMLLDISGAMKIITIMDNDEAGLKAAESITNKCSRTYLIDHIRLENICQEHSVNYADVGDMTVEEINKYIRPKIGEIL